MSDEFESCTNCIHAHDAEPLCILRLCKHAIAETKECYEPKAQPTIEPERKKGRWMPHKEKSREYIGTVLVNVEYDYWLCDTCGYRVENGQPIYNFCPNCGADMREGDTP